MIGSNLRLRLTHSQHLCRPLSLPAVTKYSACWARAAKKAFLAHDSYLDRDVVIGLLKTERLDASGLDLIQREARTMGRLGDHPHIVTVHDMGHEQGQPYVVSQYVERGSMRDLLKRVENHQLPIDQALLLAEQVCQALTYAHERGIVHRDVKPGNILLTKDGSAKLGDFGLAVDLGRSLITGEGKVAGTSTYISPEQAMGHRAEPRSDLYSLGVTLYEMVTGRLPFQGDDVIAVISQHLHAPPVAPSWHNPNIPETLDKLILHLLGKTPAERPASGRIVFETLAAISNSAPGRVEYAKEPRSFDRLAGGVFVGREQEMGKLKAGLGDVVSGCGQILMLVGEAGSGKTSTAEQFATYARLRNAQVFLGRCYEGEGAPAYWPWIQAIRSYVQVREPEHLTSVMGPAAADIAQIVSGVTEKLPSLAPPPSLEPDQARFRLFNSIATFLKNAGKSCPLVLILDDLHWADRASLLLLQFLARELKDSRLLVIGTYRDMELGRQHPLVQTLGELARLGLGQRIGLRGLAERDVARFIEMTTGVSYPESMVSAVYKETEGNPFFVNEVVRLLVSEGRMEFGEEVASWSIRIPEGVREVVGRRLGHVSEECHRVLRTATVVGREFRLEVLEGLREFSVDRLLEMLEEAVAVRIIAEVPGVVGHYKFSHALVRETLYEEIGATRRVRLHSRIADVLERLYSPRPEAHLAELAYHFCRAAPISDVDKAIDYAVRAADRAAGLLAYEEAASHYEAALRTLEFKECVDEADRCELLLALGEAQRKAGISIQARESFVRAANLARKCGSSEKLARAALGLEVRFTGATAEKVDQFQIDLAEEALKVLGEGDTALRARLLAQLSSALYFSPDRRTVLSREAVDVGRRVGDTAAHLASLYSRCLALEGFEKAEERLAIATEIVQIAEEAGNREMALRGHYRCIRELVELGDIQGMERELEVYSRLAEELRQPLYLWYVPFCRAALALFRGRFDEAERLGVEAVAIGQRAQDPNVKLFFGVLKYSSMKARGRHQELEATVQGFVEKYPLIVGWRAILAELYAELGWLDKARKVFERIAANNFDDLSRDGSFVAIVVALSNVCSILGDSLRAQKLYDLLLPFEGRTVMGGRALVCGGAASRGLGLAASTIPRWEEAACHFKTLSR